MSLPTDPGELPPRRTLVDLALASYFVALFAAAPAATPVLSDATALSYDVALRNVIVAVAAGYLLGLAVLLRLQ